MWYTNTDEGIYIWWKLRNPLSSLCSLSFSFSSSIKFLNRQEKRDINRAICSVYIKLSTDFYMSKLYQAKIGKWFDRKRFDNCMIWTCAGNPMRFLVSRLNHSAKMSVILVSVACASYIGRRYGITSQEILDDSQNIKNCDRDASEQYWPERVFLSILFFNFSYQFVPIAQLQSCSTDRCHSNYKHIGWSINNLSELKTYFHLCSGE